mmetsp:Transcript_17094/g.32731  ORF Transcript_17094/g.32731 Transcript_17094/m.32731 type:complete len:265 (-) Transcript_17094:270-1064(-)
MAPAENPTGTIAARVGMEADDPRRFRRTGPAAKKSLNAPRAAEGIMSSFGPGKPGCFGEGGNGASVAGPLSDKAFETEAQFTARMLAYKKNIEPPSSALPLLEAGKSDISDPQKDESDEASRLEEVVPLPVTHRDYADFCHREDQERHSAAPKPQCQPRDKFQDNFMTEDQRSAEDAEVDDLLAQFKVKGNVRRGRSAIPKETSDKRAPHQVPTEELLKGYKAQAETEEQRRHRLSKMPAKSKIEKEKAAAESLAFYRQQFGLE